MAARIWHHRFWSIFKLFIREALKWHKVVSLLVYCYCCFKNCLQTETQSSPLSGPSFLVYQPLSGMISSFHFYTPRHPSLQLWIFVYVVLSTWNTQSSPLLSHCFSMAWGQVGVIHSVSIRIGKTHVCSLMYCQYDWGRLLILSTLPYSFLRWTNTL